MIATAAITAAAVVAAAQAKAAAATAAAKAAAAAATVRATGPAPAASLDEAKFRAGMMIQELNEVRIMQSWAEDKGGFGQAQVIQLPSALASSC